MSASLAQQAAITVHLQLTVPIVRRPMILISTPSPVSLIVVVLLETAQIVHR